MNIRQQLNQMKKSDLQWIYNNIYKSKTFKTKQEIIDILMKPLQQLNYYMNSEQISFLEVNKWNKDHKNLQKQLKKILREDKLTSWQYLKKIPNNQKLIFLLDNHNIILSFIHITVVTDTELQFSFSYTPISQRRNGYNSKLRKYIIEKYKKEGISYFTSIPFDGANSEPLLIKLGFKKEGNKYVYRMLKVDETVGKL